MGYSWTARDFRQDLRTKGFYPVELEDGQIMRLDQIVLLSPGRDQDGDKEVAIHFDGNRFELYYKTEAEEIIAAYNAYLHQFAGPVMGKGEQDND